MFKITKKPTPHQFDCPLFFFCREYGIQYKSKWCLLSKFSVTFECYSLVIPTSIKELENKGKHKEANQIIQKIHPEFDEISNTFVLKTQEIRTIVDSKVIIIMIFALKSFSFSLKSSQFQSIS